MIIYFLVYSQAYPLFPSSIPIHRKYHVFGELVIQDNFQSSKKPFH
ncbi:hypothetical protein Nizo2262_0472 [Lactiplantibacillus plantarum]|nr:hypothetical protein Nizo2262_0472 [Lactiplantibacillus plantarum]